METWSWAALAAFGAFGTFALGWLTFFMRGGDRVTRAETTAKDAKELAQAAGDRAAAVMGALHDLERSFADYREKAVIQFVMQDTLVAFEKRITEAQVKSETRLVTAIDSLANRVDALIEATLRGKS